MSQVQYRVLPSGRIRPRLSSSAPKPARTQPSRSVPLNGNAETYLTAEEAAKFLRISPVTLSRWRIQGTNGLPYHRFGRRVVYSRADLVSWADTQRRLSTSAPYMGHPSNAPRWSIPGVGVLHPSFDRITFVSSRSVGALKKLLPLADLRRASHNFADPGRYKGFHPHLQSVVDFVCPQTSAPLLILEKHKAACGRHSIVGAEVAFDAPITSEGDGLIKLNSLVGQLGKSRHQRRSLWSVHQPDKSPPAGHVTLPTYYFEDHKSGVKLKCYVRREKLPGDRFGGLIVRLEWTLNRKPALTRHLGGNQFGDLLAADLNAFLERNLHLEEVDLVAFGNLFRFETTRERGPGTPAAARTARSVKEQWLDKTYRAERAVFLVLRRLAYRERGKFASWEQALWTCQHSPAQIRGYLRELRDRKRQRRGRPKLAPRTQRGVITDYRINACFRPVKLQPV